VWRRIAQSVQGAGHAKEGGACQDTHGVRLLAVGPTETLIACVADGAGSARFGEFGSSIVCETILECASAYSASFANFDGLQVEDVLRWCEEARTRIEAEAVRRQCEVRELATTICTAILSATGSICFQIGDGAIILGHDGIYGVVFWPQSGEYANSTNFITSKEYRERIEFLATPTPVSDVALFTDGLERLALRFDSQTPHVPFFDPLFRALRATSEVEGLNEGLRGFLSSDQVQHRSDDDKTLILASRCRDNVHDAN